MLYFDMLFIHVTFYNCCVINYNNNDNIDIDFINVNLNCMNVL